MARYERTRPFFAVVFSLAFIVFAGRDNQVFSEVISASSEATGITTELEVTVLNNPLVGVSLGPVPGISGTAPAAYNNTNSAASASASGIVNIPILGDTQIIGVDTGLLEVEASSTADGTSGSKTTSSQATVDNVDLQISSVTNVLGIESFVTLDATEVQASASMSGDYGSLTPSGSTTITGTHGAGSNQALMTVLGVDFLIEANPLANTMFTIDSSSDPLLSALTGSIDVILNEQIMTGDGTVSSGMTVNAIHLIFNGIGVGLGPALGLGLLDGDVYISTAQANQDTTAVPEPASMFLTGGSLFCFLGLNRRRRRKETDPATTNAA